MKIRSQWFKVIVGLFITIYSLFSPIAMAQGFDIHEVKKLVNSFMASTGVSGVAISLVQKNSHKELYFGNTGHKDQSQVTDQSLFEIGSITKVLTPHLMVLAQQEGKLSIHDPVAKYIPELKANPIFNQISLKDLATHTSGLPGVLEPPRANDLKSKENLMKWLLNWKPEIPPKSRYVYSNIGIALIGFALENVYHQDWDKLLKAKILSSRKMISTYQFVPQEMQNKIMKGFGRDQKPADLLSDSWLYYPAGVLKSTASDLGKYLASWDEGYFKDLKESVCLSNQSCQGLGIEAHPLSDLSHATTNVEYSLGKGAELLVKKDEQMPPLSQIFIDKTGSSDGMSAYIALIPSSRVGVVILCNQWNVKERVSLGRKILSALQSQ